MSEPNTSPPATSQRRRHKRMGCQIAVLLALVLLGFIAYECRRLWKATPPYWTQNEAFLNKHDNSDLLDMADRAEKRLLSELTDAGSDGDASPTGSSGGGSSGGSGGSTVGTATAPGGSTSGGTVPVPGAGVGVGVTIAPPAANSIAGSNLNQPRSIHVSLAEVNAWLAVKLETWAANQSITLPPQLNGYMVTTEGQNVVIAFEYKGPDFSQVISGVFHVEMLPDGQASLKVVSLRGGELPLPKGLALSQVKRGVGDGASGDAVGRMVALIDGKVFTPIHKLDAARQIRLLDYKLTPDGADITVQTELRPGVKLPEEPATQP